MNYGLTFSFELAVLMNEVIGQLRSVYRGVQINEENLAMDVIKTVGPKGYFLAEDHTLRHMREMWEPKVQDRNEHVKWVELGSTSMEERAHAIVEDIIKNYVPKPLTEKQDEEIQKILDAADAASKIKG